MRIVLRVLAVLASLVALAAGVLLLPAHLQVRGVEPPLPAEEELLALLKVENGPVRVRYVNTASQRHPGGVIGHPVFLVEWADGNLFMIDAGMDRAAALEFGELMKLALGAGEAEPHGSVSELLGDDVARVAGVGFTHLHVDHTQGILPFCVARGPGAALYQTGWQRELHNLHTRDGAGLLANSCLRPLVVGRPGVATLEDFPGLGIVALGGHTPGSTLFAAAVQGRLWLFAGDIANSREALLENRGKGFVYSYLLVPENTSRTRVLRRWLTGLDTNEVTTVVVSHDLAALVVSGMPEYTR